VLIQCDRLPGPLEKSDTQAHMQSHMYSTLFKKKKKRSCTDYSTKHPGLTKSLTPLSTSIMTFDVPWLTLIDNTVDNEHICDILENFCVYLLIIYVRERSWVCLSRRILLVHSLISGTQH
jgi:hypothetical protein